MAGELTQGEKETLAAINVGASALSFAGSAFIVLCYVLFRELRKFSFKLIFYLALSDMFCSLFNILGDPGKGFFCYTQGYTTHFVCVASFLWTTTIAFTLHRTVVRHKTDVEELGAIFHLYVWGTSLVMTIIPSIGDGYGKAGAWCLVQTTPRATKMAAGMSDRQQQTDSRVDMKAMNRWGYYPLILIGSWTFATLNRIHDFVEPHQKIFWLSFLDVGTAALMVVARMV